MSTAMTPFFGKTKPSEFLQAMVDGLRAAAETPKQDICMKTFGHVDQEGVCYGCAATWALQNLAGKTLTAEQVELLGSTHELPTKDFYGVSGRRIYDFETAIDWARKGEIGELADFCHIARKTLAPWLTRWWLTTMNWRDELPAVEAAIAEMRAEGL